MDAARIKGIYISNLDFISYQSNEIINSEGSNIHYNDFYHFYNEYVKHLKEVSWSNKEIEKEIKRFPVIQRPRLSFQLLSISLIPLLAALIFRFNFFQYGIAFLVLLLAVLGFLWFRAQKKRGDLSRIIKICSSLKDEILYLEEG